MKLLLLKLSRQKILVVESNTFKIFPRNNINVHLSNSHEFHEVRVLGIPVKITTNRVYVQLICKKTTCFAKFNNHWKRLQNKIQFSLYFKIF